MAGGFAYEVRGMIRQVSVMLSWWEHDVSYLVVSSPLQSIRRLASIMSMFGAALTLALQLAPPGAEAAYAKTVPCLTA